MGERKPARGRVWAKEHRLAQGWPCLGGGGVREAAPEGFTEPGTDPRALPVCTLKILTGTP